MSFIDDLTKATALFSQGARQLGTQQRVNEAADMMQNMRTQLADGFIKETEFRKQSNALARDLQAQLVGIGADANDVQLAFKAIAPQQFRSAVDARQAGFTEVADDIADFDFAQNERIKNAQFQRQGSLLNKKFDFQAKESELIRQQQEMLLKERQAFSADQAQRDRQFRSSQGELDFERRQELQEASQGFKSEQARTAFQERMKMFDAQQQKLDERQQRNLDSQKELLGLKLSSKAKQLADKGILIPGLQTIDNVEVTPDSVKKVKNATVAYNKLAPILKEIKGMNKKFGTELTGEAAGKMSSLVRQAQLIYKSEDFANLGVLTGPDLDLLEDVIPNLTGFMAKFQNPATVRSKLNEAIKKMDTTYNSTIEVHGFKPIGVDRVKSEKESQIQDDFDNYLE